MIFFIFGTKSKTNQDKFINLHISNENCLPCLDILIMKKGPKIIKAITTGIKNPLAETRLPSKPPQKTKIPVPNENFFPKRTKTVISRLWLHPKTLSTVQYFKTGKEYKLEKQENYSIIFTNDKLTTCI